MKNIPSFILTLSVLCLWSCTDLGTGSAPITDECGVEGGNNLSCVNYSIEIQPIFSNNNLCTYCHGSSAGLSLESYTDLMATNVVFPGNSENSLLIQKLRGTASGDQMPQNGNPLNEETINLIETWIDEGAKDN